MKDYINALKEVEKEDEHFELTLSKKEVLDLVKEIERLHSIIKEASRKLRASKDHFKTQQENNAVTFTIRILEKAEEKQND